MKAYSAILGLALCMSAPSFAQAEKEIPSDIKRVTVYKAGAQIEREATVSLAAGQTLVRLTELSPYIRKESIRMAGDGSFTILSVQHQNDFLNELGRSAELDALTQKMDALRLKIQEEETWVRIISGKLDFLQANKAVAGKEQTISPEAFKSLNTIYGANLEQLNLDLLARNRNIVAHNKEMEKLRSQQAALDNKADLPSGTILVTVDSQVPRSVRLSFSYMVANASWSPSYDMRFLGLDKPLKVTHKANVSQNTGIDWKDVNLVLSTAQTDVSANLPTLPPFYLRFYQPALRKALSSRMPGVAVQEMELYDAAPEVRVRGYGSLDENSPLYIVDGVPRNDISDLDPNRIQSIEVLKDASATAVYGSRGANGVVLVTTKTGEGDASIPLTITSKRETSNEFKVEALQTIASTNKATTIAYREADLKADFAYQAVPKLAQHVFLIGKIGEWYKADLLDAEANVYLENAFVGTTVIDTEAFSDSLELSFGVDNNISIKREKLTEYSENQFIGANRKETFAFKLTLRNNKAYPVGLTVFDQLPVSTTKDILVEALDLSGAQLDVTSGKLTWNVALKANETKEIILKYSVRYPKDKKVLLE